MELEDFVAESLSQIVKGVVKAQTAVEGTGALINPHMLSISDKHTIGTAMRRGGQPVSHVEFDVAVVASNAQGSKGGIGVVAGVFALGSQGQTDKSSSSESRIQFKVPIIFPAHVDKQ